MNGLNIVEDIMSQPPPANEYLLLFRGQWDPSLSAEQMQEIHARAMAWYNSLDQQGLVKASQALTGAGRTVAGKGGRVVSDGPFVETKEAIGGYLLLRADDLEDAVAIAQACPTLAYGVTVEVRPVQQECPVLERIRELQSVVSA